MMAFRSSLSETDTASAIAINIFDIAYRMHGAATGLQRGRLELKTWEKSKSPDMTLS